MAADASTAAGMTLLDRSRLLVAGGAMLPDINFDRGPQTTVPGGAGGGGNAGVFFAIGSAFYVYKLPDRIRLGIAYASNFGLASDYSLNRVGHYYLTTNSIITGEGNPSIPYRMNEWLSVGADFSFQVARFYQQGKINNPLPRFADGGLSIESRDEAFAGNGNFVLGISRRFEGRGCSLRNSPAKPATPAFMHEPFKLSAHLVFG